MASVSVQQPPPTPTHFQMSRRQPLAINTNAVNSPYRGASKRTRAASHDIENALSPPKKRQLIDVDQRRPLALEEPEAKVFHGRTEAPNAFQRRLAASREDEYRIVVDEAKPATRQRTTDSETLKQWRRHYRKMFPSFVFYFESLPSDVANRALKQISILGAHEEKFFSKTVTHIITTRPIPLGQAGNTSTKSAQQVQQSSKTINPLLLERQTGRQPVEFKRGFDVDNRRSTNNDILHKAREMGIKIWALEKFERMMMTMFEDEADDGGRSRKLARATKDVDLQQLLRNEKLAQVNRSLWQDIVTIKGIYVYVHDMNEKVKPVMVREYDKPDVVADGQWPMFRSVSKGRCPFVEEPVVDERRKRKDDQAKKDKTAAAASKTQDRQQAAVVTTRPQTRAQKAPLEEITGNASHIAKPPAPSATTFEPPKLKHTGSGNLDSMPPMLGSARANFQGIARNPGGEPLASGMQRGNVTSAIRSQMISSTAATAPLARAGTSKEMHRLGRRVLEKPSALSANSNGSSYMNDVRAAINHEHIPTARTSASRAPVSRTSSKRQALTKIQEDEAMTEEEDESRSQQRRQKSKAPVKRDPKPGYCENCRDKYDDFYEHVESKKHRKFALTQENWVDLDDLIQRLARPLK